MAARELLTFRNTNSAACRCAPDGAHYAGEEILSVRQTGAVQSQRESSTEPHIKMWKSTSCTRRGSKTARACHPIWGRGYPPGGSLAL